MLKVLIKAKRFVPFSYLVMFLCFVSFQTTFGQTEAIVVVDDDNSCEEQISDYDNVRAFARNEPELISTLIIIARLGDGETSRKYNQQRLTVAKESIVIGGGYPVEKIVTAQGDRVSGKGQVEFYIRGRLYAIFKVGRRKNLKGRCE